MITKGTELATFTTLVNTGLAIDPTLLDVLVDTARAILEEERPWMVLRKTDTSKTVSTSNTWQTSVDISTITDFSKLYGQFPITLFDGDNRVERYRLVPFDKRLEYKDSSNTFVFDENAKKLYFNGNVPFSGILYIHYVSTSTAIDLTSGSAVWTLFPARFLPILGFYAVGINKGAIDFDTINQSMLPEHRATLQALKTAMEKWDNDKQLSVVDTNDPTELYNGHRNGAIDIYT